MAPAFQIAGLCLAAAVAASLLRRDEPGLSLALPVAAALLGGALLLNAASELAALADELAALTGLAPELFAPLVKATAIAMLTRFVSAACADAGQSALASVMDMAGAVCALGCAVPLLRAVTELIRGWL